MDDMINSDVERQAPISLKDAEPSHLARYNFSLKHLSKDDTVLDAPCGSGYGAKLLSFGTRKVFGIDIFLGAIKHAEEFFSNKKSTFLVGDIQNMKKKFSSGQFDKVISFEGIEHLKNPEKFLLEAKRVLKKDGRLIISTPRKPHGSPYHIYEFTLEEFVILLSKYFTIEKMFGQIYTDIFDLSERKENPDKYKRFNFIAICRK